MQELLLTRVAVTSLTALLTLLVSWSAFLFRVKASGHPHSQTRLWAAVPRVLTMITSTGLIYVQHLQVCSFQVQ